MKKTISFLVSASVLILCAGIAARAATDYHAVQINSTTYMSATASSDSYAWGASIACYGDAVNVGGYVKVNGTLKWDGTNAPTLLDNNYLSYNGIGNNKKVEVKAISTADGNHVEASVN